MKTLLSLLFFLSLSAAAQDWPAKPVHVVVPYPPGGGHDFTSRVVAQKLSDNLKQSFVVEIRRRRSSAALPGSR